MGSFPSGARSAAKIAFCKEPGKVLFVEYEILGFGIWNTAQGIRNPTKNGIWNQCSTEKKNQESSNWNLESMAWNPESKTVLDRKEKETRFIPCLLIIAVICPKSLPSVLFRTIGYKFYWFVTRSLTVWPVKFSITFDSTDKNDSCYLP